MHNLADGRILVTGGAGFIGSHIVDALLEAGHECAALDDLSSGSRDESALAALLAVLGGADTTAAGDTCARRAAPL